MVTYSVCEAWKGLLLFRLTEVAGARDSTLPDDAFPDVVAGSGGGGSMAANVDRATGVAALMFPPPPGSKGKATVPDSLPSPEVSTAPLPPEAISSGGNCKSSAIVRIGCRAVGLKP